MCAAFCLAGVPCSCRVGAVFSGPSFSTGGHTKSSAAVTTENKAGQKCVTASSDRRMRLVRIHICAGVQICLHHIECFIVNNTKMLLHRRACCAATHNGLLRRSSHCRRSIRASELPHLCSIQSTIYDRCWRSCRLRFSMFRDLQLHFCPWNRRNFYCMQSKSSMPVRRLPCRWLQQR